MYLHSVSVSIVNLDVTTEEQWDGCAAQVTLRCSDILLWRTALRPHLVLLVIPANYSWISMTICIRRSYVATGFQTYKKVNNLWKCEHVSVTVCSCKRWERKRNENFEVPDSSLVWCGTISIGKRRLSDWEFCLHLQDRAVEE